MGASLLVSPVNSRAIAICFFPPRSPFRSRKHRSCTSGELGWDFSSTVRFLSASRFATAARIRSSTSLRCIHRATCSGLPCSSTANPQSSRVPCAGWGRCSRIPSLPRERDPGGESHASEAAGRACRGITQSSFRNSSREPVSFEGAVGCLMACSICFLVALPEANKSHNFGFDRHASHRRSWSMASSSPPHPGMGGRLVLACLFRTRDTYFHSEPGNQPAVVVVGATTASRPVCVRSYLTTRQLSLILNRSCWPRNGRARRLAPRRPG